MKNRRVWFAVLCLMVVSSLAYGQQNQAQATVPRLVQFSGTVQDSLGKPASGTVSLTFALYQEQEGGTPLWVETQSVQADAQGHYTVFLGANTPEGLPLEVFVTGTARWLGVTPALPGVGEQPRVLLVGVPYALKAADADTLGGMPASAFLLATVQAQAANQSANGAPASGVASSAASVGGSTAASGQPQRSLPSSPNTPTCGANTVKGAGHGTYVPIWSGTVGACSINLGQSNIFQDTVSGNVGIGNSTPAGALDVSGNAFIRGTLQLPALGTATSSTGFNSQAFDALASAFNGSAAVSQHFRWQAEPVNNNSPSASGTFNLLFASGSGTPAETGLSIASNGDITFAPGQMFPGTGTITGVTAGTGLTGGGSSGNVTLNVNEGVVAFQTDLAAGITTAESVAETGAESYANSTFLKLAGGALTGGLTGTTSNFSSTVNASAYQIGSANVLSKDSGNNVFVGSPEASSTTGIQNTATGVGALSGNTTGNYNTANGYLALAQNNGDPNSNQALDNTATGAYALVNNTTGAYNTASGEDALSNNHTGSANTVIGYTAGFNLGSSNSAGGSGNIMVGNYAGVNLNANESNNIDIGNAGVTGDGSGANPAAIRIGNQGTQGATFIAGINGATPPSPLPVVIGSNGQLGTGSSAVGTITGVTAGTGLTGGGSSGIVTLNVNEGVVAFQTDLAAGITTAESAADTYANNTFLTLAGGTLSGGLTGTAASFSGTVNASAYQIGSSNVLSVPDSTDVFVGPQAGSNNTGSNFNAAIGQAALGANTTGVENAAIGNMALQGNTAGSDNTASGFVALNNNTTGSGNTASGTFALLKNITGSNNTAYGVNAGFSLGSTNSAGGDNNIMVGSSAGNNLNANESNNIDIGNAGVTGDGSGANPAAIRIGNQGSQGATFIAGINGVAVGTGDGIEVFVGSAGQLGTVSSSRRYKEDIHDMGAASDGLLRLRPVTFRYKKPYADGSKPIQYGLIAEEVAEVYPDLVVRGKDGQVETVQYYKLDAMLLNEIQKQAQAHAADQERIAQLEAQTEQLQSQVAEQRKQGQEQQAAMKQLLAQVHGIQVTLAGSRSASLGRPHRRVARTAGHKATKPEVKHPSGQAAPSLIAKVRF